MMPIDRPARRIAVMIGGLGQGGSERQLYLFLSHCDRSRWEPVLYVSGELGAWEAPIRALRVPIVLLRGSQLAKLRQFRSAFVVQGAEAFFSWSSYTNGFGLALAGLPARRVGSFRNAELSDLPVRLRRAWRWISLHGVSVAVCNSRETEAAIGRIAGRRLTTRFVPNAVEVPSAESVHAARERWRASLGLPDGAVLVVGAGRLTPQKNFSRFLEVIAAARSSHPVHAVIAGEDHGYRRALEQKAAALDLQDRVRFIGSVPNGGELIGAADVFLLSSDYEGMPNVVLEAMAAGVPAVSTRVNGVADLIRPGSEGFLAGQDAQELARHVSLLADNPSLRRQMGANARAAIESRHRPEQIIPSLWALCAPQAPTRERHKACA